MSNIEFGNTPLRNILFCLTVFNVKLSKQGWFFILVGSTNLEAFILHEGKKLVNLS